MSKRLTGKVALVTGGSRGLGAAIAAELAEQGADVIITYVASAQKADAVVAALETKGVRALALRSDQGDLTSAGSLVEEVMSSFGRLDILVNNAALAIQGKRIDDPQIDNAALDRQWRVNVSGVVATIRAAAPVLTDGGRIISVGSGLGTRVGFSGTADYAASKAAIVGYTKGAARDLGRRNITVNVVQPGVMATDMAAGSAGNLPASFMDTHAIGRIATVEEVAAVIAFIAGPDAGYITGSVVDVNGGFTA
ncbi:SDR family oxidoreductase [Sodalis ligni]|jgi:NAD(P)-dependent dehydrogenase (short-subunit alcohol dehydrogenase family)|uniref:NAD(P)-dependent dehydrogenase (Short-subunit alcohol dehydrogenase family) n=1 Tax=Sodalis ligni TaxID=2697027 RepID=A0A4R1NIV0_9GAMM|nr:SDR family oxidoreductase [Sodalis ligni]QWA09699.1 SDR family oxidoreductase [Sodalis ligni]TCL07019.1 NAD(P)-dependent dehydrogenase (short-subunit alcohol dehydrogenase family) [Sodalis ligni]